MLDIVGDLALVGRPIRGRHCRQTELAGNCNARDHRPDAETSGAARFSPPPAATPKASALPRSPPPEIPAAGDGAWISTKSCAAPPPYPFLLVDRILKIEGNHISGLKP
jgi:hypothetical protein